MFFSRGRREEYPYTGFVVEYSTFQGILILKIALYLAKGVTTLFPMF